MATSAASQSKAVITFSSSFFAQIVELGWSGLTREAIDTSHQALTAAQLGNKTFIGSKFVDPGELSVTLNFNPDTTVPMQGATAAETVTVAIGDSSTQASWAASGFMTSFEWTGPLEDRMTATCTIKLSGAITKTSGA